MEIKDTQGNILLDVPVTQSAVLTEELMKQYSITLRWDAVTADVLPVGAYIEHNGVRYSLLEPYSPTQKDEATYEYSPVFQHPVMRWGKALFFFYTYSGGSIVSKELDWSLTDNPANFMSAICDAIENETGEKWSYEVASDLPASASLSFSNTDIFSGLNSIAGAFETEWWFDYANKIVYLSKAGHGSAVTLEVGQNVGVPQVTQNKEGYYTRFYGFGSTRNIDQSYAGANVNSIVNRRLTLDPAKYPNGYIDIREGLTQEEVLSVPLVFDDIYPRSSLTISDVKVRMMWRLDDNSQKVQIGTDSEGNPVYDQYAIWYFKIPGFAFSKDLLISGKSLSVHFNSGSLNGREFELTYHDKSETLSNSDGTDFVVEAGDYEINFVEEGSYIIPAVTGLIPAEGDAVTLFNIIMPEEYKASAYAELEEAVRKRMAQQEEDRNNYSFESNKVAFYESNPNLSIGRLVTFVNGSKSISTRVIKLETQLDYPFEQRITVGNAIIKGSQQTLKEEVVNANQNIDLLAAINESSEAFQQSLQRTQKAVLESIAKMPDLGLSLVERDGKTWLRSRYSFFTEENLAFGGMGKGSTSEEGLSRVTIYLGETPYTSETGVVRLPAYPVIPTDISAFNNDKAYATVTEVNNAISTAIFPLSGNINTLQGSINTLQGYFTNGSANNALKLGGQLPEYYATNSALTAVSDRVIELEKLFYYDAEHDAVRTSLSLIVDQWLTFGGAAMGSGSVTGSTTLAGLNDVQITEPTDGQSLVYDATLNKWVNKAVSGGVSGDYLPITGGVVSGTIYTTATPGITLKRGDGKNPYLRFTNLEDVNYGEVGVTPDGSFAFWPAVSGAQGYGQWNTVLHSTNYSSYALPLSGGTITNNSTHNPLTISTNALHPAGYGSSELVFLWNGYQRVAVGFTETHGGFVATPDIDGLSPWYYLGVKPDGTPYYCVSEAFYPLLHTGNTTEAIVEGVTVPFAGTIYSVPDFTNSFTTRRSFIGSVYLGGNTEKWYNVISVRHRNGVSDGTGYGMYIATRLTETQDLFWNKQTSPGVWQGERTIIDSANIGSQSVNYANSAGNADTLDGYHASSLLNGAYINASITANSSGWYRIGFIPSVGEVRGKISFNIRTGGGNYTPHTTNIEIDLSWNIDGSAIYAVGGGGYFNAIRINLIDGGTSIECYFVQSVTSSMELNVPVDNYYNGILCNTSVSWSSGALKKIDSTGTNKSISCGVGQYSSSYGFSGNASSASKLATTRTIWGQPFDGTGNVDGVITTMQVSNSSVPVIKFSNGEHLDNWGNFCFGENSGTWSVRNSTSLTTQTYLQVVRATGNVLIGTTTDYGSKLYVKSTTTSQGVIAAFDSSYSNYGYNYTNMAILFNGAVKGSWGWNNVPYSLGTQYNAGIFLLNDISGSGINIYDTGEILVRTSFMRTLGNLVADGNVLIGTTTDNSIKLQVSGNSASIAEMTSSHASEVGVRFKQNTTNKAWVGYYTSYGACLYNYSSGTHVGLADDGVLKFGANSSGLASLEFKKADTDLWQFSARYNSNQNGYFNIYHYNGTTWTTVLQMYKTGGVNVTGNFVATGAVTFNLASDRRLKSNIKPLTYRNTMRVLHRLRPVSFEWNETAVSLDSTRQGLCDGFIADEYEGLIPNSGRDIWEKYRAIDYTRAIPYLAKGWQIHESELDKMRRKVKTMERRIKHLENLLVEHNSSIGG